MTTRRSFRDSLNHYPLLQTHFTLGELMSAEPCEPRRRNFNNHKAADAGQSEAVCTNDNDNDSAASSVQLTATGRPTKTLTRAMLISVPVCLSRHHHTTPVTNHYTRFVCHDIATPVTNHYTRLVCHDITTPVANHNTRFVCHDIVTQHQSSTTIHVFFYFFF